MAQIQAPVRKFSADHLARTAGRMAGVGGVNGVGGINALEPFRWDDWGPIHSPRFSPLSGLGDLAMNPLDYRDFEPRTSFVPSAWHWSNTLIDKQRWPGAASGWYIHNALMDAMGAPEPSADGENGNGNGNGVSGIGGLGFESTGVVDNSGGGSGFWKSLATMGATTASNIFSSRYSVPRGTLIQQGQDGSNLYYSTPQGQPGVSPVVSAGVTNTVGGGAGGQLFGLSTQTLALAGLGLVAVMIMSKKR